MHSVFHGNCQELCRWSLTQPNINMYLKRSDRETPSKSEERRGLLNNNATVISTVKSTVISVKEILRNRKQPRRKLPYLSTLPERIPYSKVSTTERWEDSKLKYYHEKRSWLKICSSKTTKIRHQQRHINAHTPGSL